MTRPAGRTPRAYDGGLPAREFLHPLPLAALLLLVLNDHLLKPWLAFPRPLAGKLSDFAGLFYFPLLLTASWSTLRWAVRRVLRQPVPPRYPLTRAGLLAALVATALPFCLLKLSTTAAALLVAAVHLLTGRHLLPVADATDLWALLMLPLAYLHGRRFIEGG